MSGGEPERRGAGLWDVQLQRAFAALRDPARPPLLSLVDARFEDGAWSGVPRFDYELRKALPELASIKADWRGRGLLRLVARIRPDAIVITGNEYSLHVPPRLRTIVVHHGCAQTHFDRDPDWRGRGPRAICRAQRLMYRRPNRFYVAPSSWAAERFAMHYGVPRARVIPHWVETIARPAQPERARKVVLGDFRNFNKGRDALGAIAARLPDVELRTLQCTYATRQAAYANADGYLSLSLSEGCSYALCDAEAAALPIAMTNVGNCTELTHAEVIDWRERDRPEVVARAVHNALARPRGPSLYASFDLWAYRAAWRALIAEVANQ